MMLHTFNTPPKHPEEQGEQGKEQGGGVPPKPALLLTFRPEEQGEQGVLTPYSARACAREEKHPFRFLKPENPLFPLFPLFFSSNDAGFRGTGGPEMPCSALFLALSLPTCGNPPMQRLPRHQGRRGWVIFFNHQARARLHFWLAVFRAGARLSFSITPTKGATL
jgi:hypothetical protein